MKTTRRLLALAGLLAGLAGYASGAVTLPPIFSDHAVLQKSAKTPIWGTAAPGEKIRVSLGKIEADCVAASDGKWQATLDLSASDPGPFEVTVEGTNKITLKDILVGEVWLCSGQSNMEFVMSKSTGAAEEIAASQNPQLRQFLVKHRGSGVSQDSCDGAWTEAGPQTTGAFTGVGYYFGKTLQHTLGRPVAVINASWGGTPLEAWLPSEAFDSDPDLQAGKQRDLTDATSFPGRQKDFVAQFHDWTAQNGRTDRTSDASAYAGPSVDESGWTNVTLPGLFSAKKLPASGAIWFRKKVTVPAQAANMPMAVRLGVVDNFDTVYWNGEEVGSTSPDQTGSVDPRSYEIPADKVQAGEAVIALRVYSPWDMGGVDVAHLSFQAGNIPLTGSWLAKAEYELPPLTPEVAATHPLPPKKPLLESNLPTHLYNGLIQPLSPYGIAGVLWYQGEHNTPRAFEYRSELPLLIQAWRKLWGVDFPFYFCQLPNFMAKKNVPEESPWAEMRESQSQALALPDTAMAVLVDVGEEGTIHPLNKKVPGERLAAIALAKNYGQKVPFSSPIYHSMTIEADKVRIRFDDGEGGLVAQPLPATYQKLSNVPATTPLVRNSPNSELEGFAICGTDKQWKWADAKIDGDTVLVWSSQVTAPVAVRYAWASNPTCNLYNAAGFPAAPFRTDDFPLSTAGKNY